MILHGNRPGERRTYANKIGSEKCDLNLGVVLAVEENSLLGFRETNNRTDLFQLCDVLRGTDSDKTQNTTKDCERSFHISFLLLRISGWQGVVPSGASPLGANPASRILAT